MLKVIIVQNIYETKILSKQLQRIMFRVTAKVRLNIETTLRGQAEVYATSVVVGSMKVGVLEEGAEFPGAGVEGVGVGRIRDTSLGAYSFTLLKNPFISVGGRA
jgi:hypothetical protein